MNTKHEVLFSYGHLRENYLNSSMESGKLLIKNFLRTGYLNFLNKELVKDYEILKKTPNTDFQISLSPISRQCLWELHSGIMIRVIENITNITNLLPDTHCKKSRLLLASSASSSNIESWHDSKTQQDVVIVLTIFLDSGDAIICTNQKTLSEIFIASNALQIVYWKQMHGLPEGQP